MNTDNMFSILFVIDFIRKNILSNNLNNNPLLMTIFILFVIKYYLLDNKSHLVYKKCFDSVISNINNREAVINNSDKKLNKIWLSKDYLYREYQSLYSGLIYYKYSVKKNTENIFYDIQIEKFSEYLNGLIEKGISTINEPSQKIIIQDNNFYALNINHYNEIDLINNINSILNFDNNLIPINYPPKNSDPYISTNDKDKVCALILFIIILNSYEIPLSSEIYLEYISDKNQSNLFSKIYQRMININSS